jgi:ketosteroid isomerase-like protein
MLLSPPRALAVALLATALGVTIAGAQSPAAKHPAAPAANRDAERTLFRLEDEFAQAVVKRDARALGRLVAPRWVYSDASGVMQRDAGIAAFTTGSDTVREASNAEMRALVYDNSAIVIGILQMKGRGSAGPFTRRYRYTDSWVKLDGRWQCVASQDYLMPNAKR